MNTEVMTDFLDPRNAEGMPNLADSTFALDFLLDVKNGVRNMAFAICEIASPEIRQAIKKMLFETIEMHDEIVKLMLKKGWLHPFNQKEQFKMDMKSSNLAVKIAQMDLFPDNNNRLGTFATPNK